MREHDEVEVGAALEHRLRVLALRARRAVQHRAVARGVGELARQLVRDPEPDAGVERSERRDNDRMTRDAVHQLRAPELLAEPVAVRYEGPPPRQLQRSEEHTSELQSPMYL